MQCSTPLEIVLAQLPDARPDGKGFKACCPAHEDHNPSLVITLAEDGKVLLRCWSGCSTDSIVEAMGLRMQDLFPASDHQRHAPLPKAKKEKRIFATADEALVDYERHLGPRAATWSYHDQHGNQIGAVARWNKADGKKDIRPVSLNCTGWTQEGMAEPRPLYRLLEVLTTTGRIYIPEGEQCVDDFRSIGLVATTSPHGAQSADKADWSVLAGKAEIVISPDNDDAGEKYKADVIAQVSKLSPRPRIKILRLVGLPAGGDIHDWLEDRDAIEPDALRQTIESLADEAEVVEIIDQTTNSVNCVNSVYAPEDWQEPIPLGADPGAEFPIDAIPVQVRPYLEQLAEFTQTPVDLSAGMWLATTGVAIQKKFVVEPSRGWPEPLNLFVLSLMDPANRKSAVVAAIAKPIRLFEETQAEQLGPTIREARSAHEIRAKQRQRLVDEVAKTVMGSDRDVKLHELKQLDEEIADNPFPAEPRLLADDITPEHLATRMAQNNGRLGVLTAEGDLFDIMSGRYSAKGQPNIGIFLKSHAGDEVRVDRGNRPSEFIRSPALSIGCCVQPEVMRGLMQQKSFRGRGLLGRFLYQLPESLLGRRKTSPQEVDPMTESDYLHVMRKLLGLSVEQDDNGEFIPEVISLSREADESFREFREEIELSLGDFGSFATIKDWAGKLPGAVARIAGLMHVVEHTERQTIPTVISGETMQNAIRLGHYFASHAIAVFGVMGRDESVALAEHIIGTIKRHNMQAFSRRDLHQQVRRRVEKPEELDAPLKILVDLNYLREVRQAANGPGRKPSPTYETNPKLAGMKI